MNLEDACVELRYAKDWTPQSAAWYRCRLGQFVTWCKEQGVTQIDDVTIQVVRHYQEHLKTRTNQRTGANLDSYTVHGHIATIRTLLFWAANEGLVDEKIPQKIKPPKREQKVLEVLTPTQLELLFKVASQTTTPLRDTAILSLLLDTGCRVSELCGVKLHEVHFDPDSAWMLVHGKGRKQRPVALGKKARLALSRYLHRERDKDSASESAFLGRKGPLTYEGVERLLYRLRDMAGAEKFGVTVAPHRWRHTHAVMSLMAGQDIYAVSRSMGHSDIGVTTNYLKSLSDYKLMEKLTVSPLDGLR